MPELPDVEVFRQYLDATALHQKIAGVKIDTTTVLDDVSRQALIQTLSGRQLESTRRHGKHLLAALDRGSYLTLHFGMTGYLKYFKDSDDSPDHVRLLLSFAGGYHLAYVSQRKLGRVGLTADPEKFIREKDLGPDALELDLEGFRDVVAGRRGMLKSTLMNQSVLAGLGNVYSDEILYHCGLHPKVPADSLDADVQENLFKEMRQTLQEAIQDRADPRNFPESWLIPQRHEGGECPKGHGRLEWVKVAGRRACYCPRCQPVPA
jgi:formamidopyrimidine-DNA glycosylase